MKKHQLAVAIAATLPFAAMAQVTVSGTLDGGYYSVKTVNTAGTDTTQKMSGTGIESRNSTSEIVISGTEDLGQGLKAFFRFSNAIGSTTDNITEATDTASTGALAARDVFIGLSGGFGSFQIGRFTPATETLGNGFAFGTVNFVGHALDTSTGYTTNQLAARSIFTPSIAANDFDTTANNTAEFGRADDQIQYTSPTMSGLSVTLGAATAKEENAANRRLSKQTDVALRYSMGPVSVGAAQAKKDYQAGANTTAIDAEVTVIGVSYKLGAFEFRAVNGSNKVSLDGAQIQKQNMNALGVSTNVGSMLVYASMGKGENKGSNTEATHAESMSANQLGIQYNLSKRTNVYGIYGSNKAKQKSTGDDESIKGTTIGLRHSF